MVKKELKRLRRTELLEILLEQGKENEQLKKKIKELENELSDRKILINETGSIAEAALAMNGMFEAAEASCQQHSAVLTPSDL